MARFSKIATLSAIVSTGIVPVFYHQCSQTAKDVLKACYDGGIRAFEFTNRGEFAHEVFAELSKFAAAECPGMVLGAGSVVDGPTAALYIQLGANFIVGPMYNPVVKNIKAPMPWSMLMATGAVEPTEENLSGWFRAGITCVGMGSKLFPAEAIAAGDWDSIAGKCREALSIVAKYRK